MSAAAGAAPSRGPADPGEGDAAARILVRCPNWLGDVVMATAGLRALRAARPKAWIVGLLPGPLAPLLEGGGLFDEIWPLASRGGGGLAGFRADVRRIAAARFDLGIVIPESISSAWLMRAGRVRHVMGFSRDPLRRLLLHEAVPVPPSWGRRRLVSRERFVLALIAAASGAPARDVRLALSISESEEKRLEAVWNEQSVSAPWPPDAASVVLAPGASFGDSKCWPASSYAALGDRLAARGHPVILLGGPGEHDRLAAVRAAMTAAPIVLDGSLDLGAVKALFGRVALLIANDAGARHIAAAFGVPSVVFFGPTSVEKTADNLAAIEILEGVHDCRPCYQRSCPIDHRCLREISVEDALAAADRALARRSAVAPGVPA